MHISVRMTIRIILDFCHAYFCTNDYPYYFRFWSCTSLYEWLSMLFLVFVMHISIRMTIHWFFHAHLCTNDYFVTNLFPRRYCKTGIFLCFIASFADINRWGRAPWYLSSHGEFLGVFSSNISFSPSAQRSPTRE